MEGKEVIPYIINGIGRPLNPKAKKEKSSTLHTPANMVLTPWI
jgi:hypothetical protein